jgi:hypothetical protein
MNVDISPEGGEALTTAITTLLTHEVIINPV